jgi:hypothetical protein
MIMPGLLLSVQLRRVEIHVRVVEMKSEMKMERPKEYQNFLSS